MSKPLLVLNDRLN